MARSRRNRSKGKESNTATTTTTTATQLPKEGNSKMASGQVLDQSAINEFLAGSRTKGAGEQWLREFLEEGHAGMVVDLKNGIFAGKSAVQAFTALNNAKRKTVKDGDSIVLAIPEAENLRVVRRGKDADMVVAVIDVTKANLPDTDDDE